MDGDCKCYDGLFTIKGDNQHMVALSSANDEVSVWHTDANKPRKVRTLKGWLS